MTTEMIRNTNSDVDGIETGLWEITSGSNAIHPDRIVHGEFRPPQAPEIEALFRAGPAVNVSRIPEELTKRQQWCVWRYEKVDSARYRKIPINPQTGVGAKSNVPATWGTFGEAIAAFKKGHYHGVGYFFSASDPYVGVDIDDCLTESGMLTPEGHDAIQHFGDSYHEVSPSGRGLKFWIRGSLPQNGRGRKNSKLGVEVYSKNRFFTVTGQSHCRLPFSIQDRDANLQLWYAEKFSVETGKNRSDIEFIACPQSAADVIARARLDDPDFDRLFNGTINKKYPSQSEADLALCVMIAHWTGPDPKRIDEVFRESEIFREKWNRADYRDRTISLAIQSAAQHPAGYHNWNHDTFRNIPDLFVDQVVPQPVRSLPMGPPRIQSSHSAKPNLIDFEFIDSTEFASRKYEQNWMIEFVMKANQPLILAGPSKSMKTTFLVELCISLSSGRPLWNKFRTTVQRVALISAESGEETLQETAVRICQSKEICLEDLSSNLFWAFRPPDISAPNHLESLRDFIVKNAITVLAIDPAYLSMGDIGEAVNNQFAIGPVLERLSTLMHDTGVTVILAAHTGKGCRAGKQLELSDIAHAGFGQWARQWFLVNRRVPYNQSTPGMHDLWVSFGGSAGHAGCWAVSINEGMTQDGRRWNYSVQNASEVQVPPLSGGQPGEDQQELERRLLDVITFQPETIDAIAKKVSMSRAGKKFIAALDNLVASGRIQRAETSRQNGASPIKKYSRSREEPKDPAAGENELTAVESE